MVPKSTVHLTGQNAAAALKLLEALEDHDDVQNVSANWTSTPPSWRSCRQRDARASAPSRSRVAPARLR